MTISATNRKNNYVGNDLAVNFAYTFQIADETELEVYLLDTTTDAETLQTLNSDYTVTGVGVSGGGNVVMATAPSSTEELIIKGVVAISQETDFDNQGGWHPEVHEAAFDKLTKVCIDLQEQLDRCVKINVTDPTTTNVEFDPVEGVDQFVKREAGGDMVLSTYTAGVLTGVAGYGNTASRPGGLTAADAMGYTYYNTELKRAEFWDGANWQGISDNFAIDLAAFGVVYETSDDTTAAANTTALNTAIAFSSANSVPIVFKGNVWSKGENLIAGDDVRIFGYGYKLYQKDTSENGLKIDATVNRADIFIYGLTIQGMKKSTDPLWGDASTSDHAAAGIYGVDAGSAWFLSGLFLKDVTITRFRYGTQVFGVSRFTTDNLTISYVRVGQYWDHIQSSAQTMLRITVGDDHADSCMFQADNTSNYFGNSITGGEFGHDFKHFVNATGPMMVTFTGINVETLTGGQVFNLTGSGSVSFRISAINCRFATTAGTFLSLETKWGGNSLSGTFIGNWGSSFTRFMETWSTTGNVNSTSPRLITSYGYNLTIVKTNGQGGAADASYDVPAITASHYMGNLLSASLNGGHLIQAYDPAATSGYKSAQNIMIRQLNGRDGTKRYASLVNDMMQQIVETAGSVSSVAATETALFTVDHTPNIISATGESLTFRAYGNTAANANTKQFKVNFDTGSGPVNMIDFGAIVINGLPWMVEFEVARQTGGSGWWRIAAKLTYGSNVIVKTTEFGGGFAVGVDFDIILTATAAGAADVYQMAAKAEWTCSDAQPATA